MTGVSVLEERCESLLGRIAAAACVSGGSSNGLDAELLRIAGATGTMSGSKNSDECSGDSMAVGLRLALLLCRIKQNTKARITSKAIAKGMPRPTASLSARENPDVESDVSVKAAVTEVGVDSELAVTVMNDVAVTDGKVDDGDVDAAPDSDADSDGDADVEVESEAVVDCDDSADVVAVAAAVLGPNSLVR
ncbi:hypothetical protein LQW54_008297 [Pestalotiopsis sp. IQ-011]